MTAGFFFLRVRWLVETGEEKSGVKMQTEDLRGHLPQSWNFKDRDPRDH